MIKFSDLKPGNWIRLLSNDVLSSEFIVLQIEICGGLSGNNALVYEIGCPYSEHNPQWRLIKDHYNISWQAKCQKNETWNSIDYSDEGGCKNG